MGHYDSCREGYCAGCGQAAGVIWACGRRNCSSYHAWLGQRDPGKLERLMRELRLEREAEEERRVVERQIKRRTAAIASEAKREAEA